LFVARNKIEYVLHIYPHKNYKWIYVNSMSSHSRRMMERNVVHTMRSDWLFKAHKSILLFWWILLSFKSLKARVLLLNNMVLVMHKLDQITKNFTGSCNRRNMFNLFTMIGDGWRRGRSFVLSASTTNIGART